MPIPLIFFMKFNLMLTMIANVELYATASVLSLQNFINWNISEKTSHSLIPLCTRCCFECCAYECGCVIKLFFLKYKWLPLSMMKFLVFFVKFLLEWTFLILIWGAFKLNCKRECWRKFGYWVIDVKCWMKYLCPFCY